MQKISFCERYMLTTAVLKRLKTNTRRLEKELERLIANYEKQYGEPFRLVEQKWDGTKNRLVLYAHTGIADTDREHVLTLNTRYKVGEVVAVAQAYKDAGIDPHYLMFTTVKEKFSCVEKEIEAMFTKGWSNKLFVRPDLMPHQIQMTGVRIERLQDISDKECLKEGIKYSHSERNWFFTNDKNVEFHANCPRAAFAALIDRPGVGRKGLWQSNPWVVVYEFKVIK